MKKIWKRVYTGLLTLTTILTALPTTSAYAAETQYWTESSERVGYIEHRIARAYHYRRNKWQDAQFPRRKDVECDRKDGLGEIRQVRKSQGI